MEITAKKFPSFVEVLNRWEQAIVRSETGGEDGVFVNKNTGVKARLGVFPASEDGMSFTERAKRFEILKENRVNALLSCYECVQDGEDVLIAHQLFSGKPLSLYLAREWHFGERETQEIILQILVALESIHARSIIHGRLMLENVLYDHEHGDVRLIGFLHIYEGGNWGAERRRIDRYLAPEFFMFSEYSYSSEIYSIAVMMMELLNGKRWLDNVSDEKVISYQVNKGFRFPKIFSGEVSKKLRDILERALDVDAELRFETLGDMRQAFYSTGGAAIVCDVPNEGTKGVVHIEEKFLDREDARLESSSVLTPVREASDSPELSSSVSLLADRKYRGAVDLPWWKQLLYAAIALTLLAFVLNNFELGMPTDEKLQMFGMQFDDTVQAITEFFDKP
jgi:serine/threonine protein kinase